MERDHMDPLTNSRPARSMRTSDTSLYVDFAGDILYQWSGSTWTQLTNGHPTGSMVVSDTSLYVDFAEMVSMNGTGVPGPRS